MLTCIVLFWILHAMSAPMWCWILTTVIATVQAAVIIGKIIK